MSGTIVCVDDQAEVRRLLAEVFKARGRDVQSFDDGEVAIAWTLHDPAVTAAIVGARSPEQAAEIFRSPEFRLSSAEIEELNA